MIRKNYPQNYLRDYRATSNRKPLSLVTFHLSPVTCRCKHGYIIVNAGSQHFNEVLARVQKAGFLWTPLYGLCADEAACEKSILVYNQKRSRKAANIADLFALAATFAAEGRLVSASDDFVSPLQAIQTHFANLQTRASVEVYVNPSPCNVNEATTRAAKGEVFFGRIYC